MCCYGTHTHTQLERTANNVLIKYEYWPSFRLCVSYHRHQNEMHYICTIVIYLYCFITKYLPLNWMLCHKIYLGLERHSLFFTNSSACPRAHQIQLLRDRLIGVGRCTSGYAVHGACAKNWFHCFSVSCLDASAAGARGVPGQLVTSTDTVQMLRVDLSRRNQKQSPEQKTVLSAGHSFRFMALFKIRNIGVVHSQGCERACNVWKFCQKRL